MSYKDKEEKYLALLEKQLGQKHAYPELLQAIVDTPFTDPLRATLLGLGITVLLLVDKEKQMINRVALSRTLHAEGSTRTSQKEFHTIQIPVGHNENIIAAAIDTKKAYETEDWKDLFVPALSPLSARFNQSNAGILFSRVEPLNISQGGAMIFSFFAYADDPRAAARFTKQYAALASEALSQSV